MSPNPSLRPAHAPTRRHRRRVALAAMAVLAPWLLTGCEELGIESAATIAAKREAEGKAVGAGCRHAGRSIEQCFQLNRRADKAAVFAGWREMEDYMRENSIAAVPPPPEPTPAKTDASDADAAAKPGAKVDAKAETGEAKVEAKAQARAPGEPKPAGG